MIITDTPRCKHDFYETPPRVAEFALRYLVTMTTIKTPVSVLDAGAGRGVWGHAFKDMFPSVPCHLTGIDLPGTKEERQVDTSRFETWVEADFRTWVPDHPYNLVIGNPPFSLAAEFVLGGLNALLPFGWLVYFLPQRFLGSQGRVDSIFRPYRPWMVLNLGARVSFTGDKKTDDSEYCCLYWHKGNAPDFSRMDWVNWAKDPLPISQDETQSEVSSIPSLYGVVEKPLSSYINDIFNAYCGNN